MTYSIYKAGRRWDKPHLHAHLHQNYGAIYSMLGMVLGARDIAQISGPVNVTFFGKGIFSDRIQLRILT